MPDDDMIAMVLDDAREKMAKAVEHARAEFTGVRTGRAAPALVEKLPGRLLRHRGPAAADRRLHRARGAPAGDQPLRQGGDERHREGDPDSRLGLSPEQRRPGDPPQLPAAHRGAPQGARAGGAGHGRGGSGQHPPCPAQRPARPRGVREGRRHLGRRPGTGREGARQAHPPATRARSARPSSTRSRSCWRLSTAASAPRCLPPPEVAGRAGLRRDQDVRSREEDDVTDWDDRRRRVTAIPPRVCGCWVPTRPPRRSSATTSATAWATTNPGSATAPRPRPARGPARPCASRSGPSTTPTRSSGRPWCPCERRAAEAPSCRTGRVRPQRRYRT